jgi:hypothetical protein
VIGRGLAAKHNAFRFQLDRKIAHTSAGPQGHVAFQFLLEEQMGNGRYHHGLPIEKENLWPGTTRNTSDTTARLVIVAYNLRQAGKLYHFVKDFGVFRTGTPGAL